MFIKSINKKELEEFIEENYENNYIISVVKDKLFESELLKLAIDKLNEDVLSDLQFVYSLPSNDTILYIILDIIQNCYFKELLRLLLDHLQSLDIKIIDVYYTYHFAYYQICILHSTDYKRFYKEVFKLPKFNSFRPYSYKIYNLYRITESKILDTLDDNYYKELSLNTCTEFRNKYYPDKDISIVTNAMIKTLNNITTEGHIDFDDMIRLCNEKIKRYETNKLHNGNVIDSKKVYSIDDIIVNDKVKFRFNKYTGNKTKYYDMIIAELVLMRRGRTREEQIKVIKIYKKKLLKIIMDKLKSNKNFIKSGIPINFLMIGDIVYRNDDVLQVTFEIKGNDIPEE